MSMENGKFVPEKNDKVLASKNVLKKIVEVPFLLLLLFDYIDTTNRVIFLFIILLCVVRMSLELTFIFLKR